MKLLTLAGLFMNPKEELKSQFLIHANDDLQLSELILNEPEPIFWAAAFHAQQCVEKALKALLTFHEIRAGKIHNIEELLKLSLPVLKTLEKFKEQATSLTVYAVDSRYPSHFGNVTTKQAEEAVEIARKIFEIILKALPDLGD